LPSESEITMIRVSPAEAAVILGFDREGGGSGISLLNSRFGGYLKSIGFLEVVGVKAHARTSINPDVASRVRFRFGKNTNLVARAAAFNGVPDAKQWRRDLLQIVDRTISDELTLGLVAQPEVVADESVAQTPVEPIVAEPTGASAPVSGGLALPASSDIGLMTDEQLADRLRLLTEFAARIEGERSTITAEIAERARRAEEARKAARRATLEVELAKKRAAAEEARRQAEQAEAEAARLAAELDTLG
jgi:hypothetical protein